MTILVTGSTGTIGSEIVSRLALQGAAVRAMTRSPGQARFPNGVAPVAGDLSDIDATRAALRGVDTLFLLVPNLPDELTQAMLALDLAREAAISRIVYLSVFQGERYADVPHFAAKVAVERMIERGSVPASVLRPAYYIQNDVRQQDALVGAGVYAMPVGTRGISMVDTRDIADAAVAELLRRERAPDPLPSETFDLVGPDCLTGPAIAALWSEALGRPIGYAGDDLEPMQRELGKVAPAWMVAEMRLMMRRYQADGACAEPRALERFVRLLGRAPRSYRAFATETARSWQG